jgi:hypothetical protein
VSLRAFLLFALASLSGCGPNEHALLIDVYTQEDIDELRVTIVSLDTPNVWNEPSETIERTAEDINADPIRLAIELGGSDRVLVQIEAIGFDPDGGDPEVAPRLIATRCYTVNGVTRDEVLLVALGDGDDVDGDSYVPDPGSICMEPALEGMPEHGCDAAIDHVCPDDRGSDCDDDAPAVHPGAGIICLNGIDEDCDSDIEEECADLDQDTFAACPESPTEPCDCNDSVAAINPDAEDFCNDSIDQDCTGTDECCDADGDGFATCSYDTTFAQDCDDDNPAANPAEDEVCDQADNDCNGQTDEIDECRGDDLDGDSHPDCNRVPGTTCDCNDCDAGIYFGAREICGNGLDEDCDGMADDGCPAVDADGDGYGPNDCRDDDRFAFPHMNGEVYVDRCGDGLSNSCIPGDPDTSCSDDTDGDGFTEPPECEGNPAIGPEIAEVCDGVDNDCDGIVDEVHDPAGQTGCGQSNRIDFQSSLNDCGACRSPCDPDAANVCVLGTCDCSHDSLTVGACASGSTCCSPSVVGGTDGGCVDILTDERHCGGCGIACGSNETCEAGVCRCGTASGCNTAVTNETCCAGACVDLQSDVTNCGSCGLACGAHTVCNSGSCGCATEAGRDWENCVGTLGSDGDGCETDILSSADSCGGCGAACSGANGTRSCSGGNCSITCNGGFGNCDTDARSNGCEAEFATNTSHCGGCGMACSADNGTPSCGGGNCTIACTAGFDNCDGNARTNGCEINIRTNVSHCGACRSACSANNGTPGCTGGNCTIACTGGFGNCDNDARTNGCENTLDSLAVCGTCTTGCSIANATESCSTDSCRVVSCDAGFDDCNSDGTSCETALRDAARQSCGSCTATCGVGESCNTSGACTCGGTTGSVAGGAVCTGGTPNCCASGCTNTATDESNCGGCGVPCTVQNGTPDCQSGACRASDCDDGYDLCDTNPATCDTPCTVTNGTGDCSGGTCAIAGCTSGFGDCAGGPALTCDPLNTSTNCGTCGTPCNAPTNGTASCSTRTCVRTCTAPFRDCDGSAGTCETDTSSSTTHCGACNNACAPGAMCISGTCRCMSSTGDVCTARIGDSCSGAMCRCGSGDECGSTQTCTSGSCG